MTRQMDGVHAVYWNTSLRTLGMGLLGIFVPVYIFLLASQTSDSWIVGVRFVLIYDLVSRVAIALGSVDVAKWIEKIGYRKSVMLGTIFQVFVFGLLIEAEKSLWWVIASALVSGLAIMFYWLPRLSLMSSDGIKEKIGEEVGMLTLLEFGAAILGPFVGGVIISLWGFIALFWLGIGVLMTSIVPIFYMIKHDHRDGISWRGFSEFLGNKENRPYILGFIGRGMDDGVMAILWPLFMFLVIVNVRTMGVVGSLAMIVSMVVTFLAGKIFDKKRALGGLADEKMFWSSSVLVAGMRMVRSLATSTLGIFIIDGIDRVVSPFYWVPFDSYLYSAGKRKRPMAFFAYRETIYSTGRILFLILASFMIAWPYGWQWVFGLGALGVIMSMRMSVESNK